MTRYSSRPHRRTAILRIAAAGTLTAGCLVSAWAQNRADFLILANPQAYTILNKFEEQLSPQQRRALVPYSCFEVVNEEGTLGDQITSAAKLRVGQDLCYFLKDDNGGLFGDKANPYKQTFRNCEKIGDSIVVEKPDVLRMSEKHPSSGTQTPLDKGDVMVRVFKFGDLFYVQKTGITPRYGWCSLASTNAWRSAAPDLTTEKATLRPAVADRVRSRLDAVNEDYREYFAAFNKIGGRDKSVPAWKSTVDGNVMRCELAGGHGYAQQLDESTRILVKDIEGLLMGERLAVVYADGVMTISTSPTTGVSPQ